MSDYCTVQDVMAYTMDDQMDVSLLNLLIPSISRAIDAFCHRSFSVVTEARSYDLVNPAKIGLRDDLIALTSVTTNAGQTFDDTDFVLGPLSGPPYAWIEPNYDVTLNWANTPKRALTITGSWGYQASAPANIKAACAIWTAILYAASTTTGFAAVSGGDVEMKIKDLNEKPPAEVLPFLLPHVKVRIASVSMK